MNPGRKHKKLEIIYILNVVTIIINGNLKKNCTPNVKQKGMATMREKGNERKRTVRMGKIECEIGKVRLELCFFTKMDVQ